MILIIIFLSIGTTVFAILGIVFNIEVKTYCSIFYLLFIISLLSTIYFVQKDKKREPEYQEIELITNYLDLKEFKGLQQIKFNKPIRIKIIKEIYPELSTKDTKTFIEINN